MQNLISIVGPTGSGKSELAILIARQFDGEIVSADSRQVYRYMNIGTAKPDEEDLSLVRHHLIGTVDPNQEFGLAQYRESAQRAISEISARGKVPLLVGGTGQYVWSLLEGWDIPIVPPDLSYRHNLEEIADSQGPDALYRQLAGVDAVSAQRIDKRNIRRVIRALEVSHSAGLPFSQLKTKTGACYNRLVIGLTEDRTELYRRVDSRVDEMIRRGFVAEVLDLVSRGYGFALPSMSGIGYRQIGDYLAGAISLAEAVQKIKGETHRFIRHQYAWFKTSDKRITWFNINPNPAEEVAQYVSDFLEGG
jgi:tRNA dimethylallyltransferase